MLVVVVERWRWVVVEREGVGMVALRVWDWACGGVGWRGATYVLCCAVLDLDMGTREGRCRGVVVVVVVVRMQVRVCRCRCVGVRCM